MSKNKQILIFSGIGLLVLGSVTAVLMLTAPEKDDKDEPESSLSLEEEDSSLTLSNRLTSELSRLSVTNGEGTFEITPSGDDSFTIEELSGAPLSDTQIRRAVESAVLFSAKEFAEETDELSKYGLDAPKATVKASFTDGSEFSFSIGNDVPNTSTACYMTDGSGSVYTCYKSDTEIYLNGKFGFVDTAATPVYDQSGGEEVQRVEIKRSDLDEPLVIESIIPEDDSEIHVYSYRLVSPYTAYADLQDAPNFMYSYFGLNAKKVEWVGLTETDYKLSGLDEPTCVMTVTTNKKVYTLALGKLLVDTVTNEDGSVSRNVEGVYGVSSEVPDVLYLFDTDDIPALSIDPQRLISRLFLMPYIYSLDSVSYSDRDGTEFEIDINELPHGEDEEAKYEFVLDGESAKEQSVKDMYQYMISASGDELYFDDDKGELIATMTYSYNDKNNGLDGRDIVRLYESTSDRKVIIELNGENLFKTRQIYATQLLGNAKRFLSGGEIVLSY